MSTAHTIQTSHFQFALAAFKQTALGEGHQAASWSHLTLGNRAAISVTARQIFSEQGRKLWGSNKRLKGRSNNYHKHWLL